MSEKGAEREARLVGAISDDGPVSAADQLASVRRLLAAGAALAAPLRDIVADLTARIRPRG